MSGNLQALCAKVQERIGPFAGRVEYGNLRSRITKWDCGEGEPVTNMALVYETPGGSTDQINITYYHGSDSFGLVDAQEGELTTSSIDSVIESIMIRVAAIPEKRRETLQAEIRRQVDAGQTANTAGLFGHLNRVMQSEFKGGTITHLELRDAMTYAVGYLKGKSEPPSRSSNGGAPGERAPGGAPGEDAR